MQSKAGYDVTPLTSAQIDELARRLTPEEFSGAEGGAVPAGMQTAYFAGGCFWGVEDGFQRLAGVVDAVSGYQGGHTENPRYEDVCGGMTGHAETVRVTFDPTRVTYLELLNHFFKSSKPTLFTLGGQGISQYRAAIFTTDDTQRAQIEAFIAAQQPSGLSATPTVAIGVSPAGTFYEAEEHHQNYYSKHRR